MSLRLSFSSSCSCSIPSYNFLFPSSSFIFIFTLVFFSYSRSHVNTFRHLFLFFILSFLLVSFHYLKIQFSSFLYFNLFMHHFFLYNVPDKVKNRKVILIITFVIRLPILLQQLLQISHRLTHELPLRQYWFISLCCLTSVHLTF